MPSKCAASPCRRHTLGLRDRTSERPLGRRHSRPHPHCHTGTCRAPATRRHCATVYPCRGHGQPGTGNRLDRRHAPQRRRPWPEPSRRNAPRVICRFAADGAAAGRSWGAADPGSPQRHQELLDNAAPLEELVRAGCLVQVSSKSITEPGATRPKGQPCAAGSGVGWSTSWAPTATRRTAGRLFWLRPFVKSLPGLAARGRRRHRRRQRQCGPRRQTAPRAPDPLPPPRRFFFWPWSRG